MSNTRQTADYISTRTGLSRATCEAVLSALGAVVIERVKLGEVVKVGELGKFYGKHVNAKMHLKNPKTGAHMTVNAKIVLGFKRGTKGRKLTQT